MSLFVLEIPVLLVPNTHSWILLIEPPATIFFTADVQPLPCLIWGAFFSLVENESQCVSKTEKADAKKVDHKEGLENLVSADPSSEESEVKDLFGDSAVDEDLEEATNPLSRKPFIT